MSNVRISGSNRPSGGHHSALNVQKPKNLRQTLKRLVRYLGVDLWVFLLISLLSIIAVVVGLFSPYLIGLITNQLELIIHHPELTTTYVHTVFSILMWLSGVYLVTFLIRVLEQYLMAGFSQKMVYRMRKQINGKLDRVPLKFLDSRPHGELMSRMMNDVDTFSSSFQQVFTQILGTMASMTTILIFMLYISPTLTLLVLLVVPLTSVLSSGLLKKSQRLYREQQRKIGELNGHIEEIFSNHEVVKSFSQEQKAIQRFVSLNNDLYHVSRTAQFYSTMFFPIANFVGNLSYVAVSIAGGYLAVTANLPIGSIQSFILYLRQFTQQISQLSQLVNIIQSGIAAVERIFEVLDETEEIADQPNPVSINNIHTHVAFEHAQFGYHPEKILIKDLNLSVRQGMMVAIVGPTGAGKTTLVNLLLRFYELQKGKLTIDGIDVSTLSRHDLRSLFGMVLQDTWLFNGTILENIRYGHSGATIDQVHHAAEASFADHFIKALPGGYDYNINEEGNNLSQGEKQLITIARALLANPRILILDEATSSVDTRLEMLIQEAMKRLLKGRTSFVIAHRLSTIKNADMILVLDHGDIVETGTHDELLNKKGFYASLYQSQFEGITI